MRKGRVTSIEDSLASDLSRAREQSGIGAIKFVTLGKRMNLIEVPKRHGSNGSIPSHISELPLMAIHLTVYRKSLLNRCLDRFILSMDTWSCAVECVAQLDAIISLAITSESPDMCRPCVVASDEPFIDVKQLRHGCIDLLDEEFIPNDVCLGAGARARAALLTGPNMGGKSTLLRQVCVAMMMAQVGCYLPAMSARLSPADRIFSRIGANDNIIGVYARGGERRRTHKTTRAQHTRWHTTTRASPHYHACHSHRHQPRMCGQVDSPHSWWSCWRRQMCCLMQPSIPW